MTLTYSNVSDSDSIEKKLTYKSEIAFKKHHKTSSWFIDEFYFTYVIDIILSNSNIKIDFTNWKGIKNQKYLYNITTK